MFPKLLYFLTLKRSEPKTIWANGVWYTHSLEASTLHNFQLSRFQYACELKTVWSSLKFRTLFCSEIFSFQNQTILNPLVSLMSMLDVTTLALRFLLFWFTYGMLRSLCPNSWQPFFILLKTFKPVISCFFFFKFFFRIWSFYGLSYLTSVLSFFDSRLKKKTKSRNCVIRQVWLSI